MILDLDKKQVKFNSFDCDILDRVLIDCYSYYDPYLVPFGLFNVGLDGSDNSELKKILDVYNGLVSDFLADDKTRFLKFTGVQIRELSKIFSCWLKVNGAEKSYFFEVRSMFVGFSLLLE